MRVSYFLYSLSANQRNFPVITLLGSNGECRHLNCYCIVCHSKELKCFLNENKKKKWLWKENESGSEHGKRGRKYIRK